MLTVVSGHTLVHSESTNASTTALPRNWLSAIRWPNWFSSRMSGARTPPSELPGSSAGLFAACIPPERPALSAAGAPEAPDVHAASASPHAVSTATLLALAPPPRPRARLAAFTGHLPTFHARPV